MAGIGLDIDKKVYEEFSKLVVEKGYLKRRAIEGAIRAFVALPDTVQAALVSNTATDTRKLLIETFQILEIQENLGELSPEQRHHVLDVIRENAAKISQKKKTR